MKNFVLTILSLVVFNYCEAQKKPNVLLIYVDDLGYGDVSAYGASKLSTPNIDYLASQGIRFTNGHAVAATCTPSRYALMTGNYPFRQTGTGILPGDAKLIIPQDQITLPKVFKQAGYTTAMIGKWHLGLGDQIEKNWNEAIKPGPLEVGFDYSYIFPATADRVPTVFLDGHHVEGLVKEDPIYVSYTHKIGDEPTGKDNPELLKMVNSLNHGHENTIVNGIGRIGWMVGGTKARWTDEEVTFTFFEKAKAFILSHKSQPFFMSFNMNEPHVPRMPATMFKGKSGLGYRGDAILQLDYTVGQLIQVLKDNGIYENTIIIFSSDNGPVLDDGYEDGAVTELNGHDPFGKLRGGKYSAFEAGTRVPFIISWPAEIMSAKVSDALVSQVDLLASFAGFFQLSIPKKEAIDSEMIWKTLIGRDKKGRDHLVKSSGTLALIKGEYKYIKPRKGAKINKLVNIELGNDENEQLYNLNEDREERNNIAQEKADILLNLKELLKQEIQKKERH